MVRITIDFVLSLNCFYIRFRGFVNGLYPFHFSYRTEVLFLEGTRSTDWGHAVDRLYRIRCWAPDESTVHPFHLQPAVDRPRAWSTDYIEPAAGRLVRILSTMHAVDRLGSRGRPPTQNLVIFHLFLFYKMWVPFLKGPF